MALNVKRFRSLVMSLVNLQVEKKKYAPVLVCGLDGVGKNQIIEDVCREVNTDLGSKSDIFDRDAEFGCVIIKPGQGDSAGDFLGMPKDVVTYPDPFALAKGERSDERYTADQLAKHVQARHGKTFQEALAAMGPFQSLVTTQTRYSLPHFWPTSGRGILVLDELNRGGKNTESALLEVVRERKLSLAGYKVPPGWIVIGLINPPSGNFLVRDMDPAMESRWAIFDFGPETDEWLDYARRANLNEDVQRFAAEMPQFIGLDYFENPIIKDLKPRPRRLETLSLLMEAVPEDLVFECARGTLGPEGAMSFMEVRKAKDKPVKGEQVLKEYAKVQKSIKRYTEAARNDLVSYTVNDLLDILKARKEELEAKEMDHIVHFLKDCAKDLQIVFARQLGNNPAGSNLRKHYDQLKKDSKEFKTIIMATLHSGVRMEDVKQ